MKPHFKRVCIIGVGLIGGSLAQAIKLNKIAYEVVGFFRSRKSLKLALSLGIVDKGYLNLSEAVSGSELIILSTPVYEIIRIGKEMKKFLSQDVIVTDVGSTKLKIVKELSKIYSNYIGSHPLAGSEKRGFNFSSPDLFLDKITILTPVERTKKDLIKIMKNFWESLGCKVFIMSAEMHDRILSRVSHLPHILMFAVMNLLDSEKLTYVSSGFKDATRIAASEPKLWSQIFLTNKVNILKDIDLFIKKLQKYYRAIKEDRQSELINFLTQASLKRQSLE